MPVPAITQAMRAPYTPVACAKLRGRENTPAPTMEPTTMAASVISGSFCVAGSSRTTSGRGVGSGRSSNCRADALIALPSCHESGRLGVRRRRFGSHLFRWSAFDLESGEAVEHAQERARDVEEAEGQIGPRRHAE